jgi:hypothetical protein
MWHPSLQVVGFQPSEADLDYPGKLERAAKEAVDAADAAGSGGEEAATAAADNAQTTWYPPLARTLTCLSKLYRCVDAGIFAGLAQEAVAAAADAIHIGRRGVARRSSALDGMLFLVRHLLVLREQIAPFNLEFAVVNKASEMCFFRAV